MTSEWKESDDILLAMHTTLSGREDIVNYNALVFFAAQAVVAGRSGQQQVDPDLIEGFEQFIAICQQTDDILKMLMGDNYLHEYLARIEDEQ